MKSADSRLVVSGSNQIYSAGKKILRIKQQQPAFECCLSTWKKKNEASKLMNAAQSLSGHGHHYMASPQADWIIGGNRRI